ncbi:unnamed protein product [Adineta steineri]|uniref:Ig-like domain-containing protein n=1 Tax=Adineta steineri TaxID=433720 RepID=A0A818PNH8_9BILA|nr:unnamed protein product [Adineta steineri]
MKLALIFIVSFATIYVASSRLLSSTEQLVNRPEINLLRRLVKRQAYNDPHCDRRACAVPNCGKDYVATTLQGECCERCVPWEYARSLGIPYTQGSQGPQAQNSYRPQQQPQPQPQPQPHYDPYAQQPQQQQGVDVYIYGPDEGARVSSGQGIYFDCEVVAPYNQHAQPRWSRGGNQPLPHKAQSTVLSGNRKLARLTIPDANHGDAGRYVCSAGTGNPRDETSIDLQVTDGGYNPRPQPTPAPYPAQPNYPSYDPYNQPGYYPQPQPQPQPQPSYPAADNNDDGDDDNDDADDNQEPANEPATPAPAPAAQEGGDEGQDDGEYPEDYTENEK